jgi:hypothetical protein
MSKNRTNSLKSEQKIEIEDRDLFDHIACEYAEKDFYGLSHKARTFQLKLLLVLFWQIKEGKSLILYWRSVEVMAPQKSNPLIQLARGIKKNDSKYYETPRYFFGSELIALFQRNSYQVDRVKYQEYFSVLFVQIKLKPKIIFTPLRNFSIFLDRFIQIHSNSIWAWNIFLLAKPE